MTEPLQGGGRLFKWTVREMEDALPQAMSQARSAQHLGLQPRASKDALTKRRTNSTRQVQTGYDEHTGKPVFEEQPRDRAGARCRTSSSSSTRWPTLCWSPARTSKPPCSAWRKWRARPASISSPQRSVRPSTSSPVPIKANFPTRISFQVTAKVDSRTILGEQGAEQLLGQGDLLYMAAGGRITPLARPVRVGRR